MINSLLLLLVAKKAKLPNKTGAAAIETVARVNEGFTSLPAWTLSAKAKAFWVHHRMLSRPLSILSLT